MTANSKNCEPPTRQFSPLDFILPRKPRFGVHVPGYVYVIQAEPSEPVKIGQAVDPLQRLADLQCAHWKVLSLVAVAGVFDNFGLVEKRAHKLASRFRLRGEWFDVSPLEAVEMIAAAARQTGQVALPLEEATEHAKRRFSSEVRSEFERDEAERRRLMRVRLGIED